MVKINKYSGKVNIELFINQDVDTNNNKQDELTLLIIGEYSTNLVLNRSNEAIVIHNQGLCKLLELYDYDLNKEKNLKTVLELLTNKLTKLEKLKSELNKQGIIFNKSIVV